jgi:hypothetical protein
MDIANAAQQGGVSAAVVLVLGVIYKLYLTINHHRVRGKCCGKACDASIDIDETTPPAAVSSINPISRGELAIKVRTESKEEEKE